MNLSRNHTDSSVSRRYKALEQQGLQGIRIRSLKDLSLISSIHNRGLITSSQGDPSPLASVSTYTKVCACTHRSTHTNNKNTSLKIISIVLHQT